MLNKIIKYGSILLPFFFTESCRKSYAPGEINANHLFLSVDGFINTGSHAVSTIKLTRSQNLTDTLPSIPELGATVTLQATNGADYPLSDTGKNGIYVSPSLTLDNTQTYIVSIATTDGMKYASDPVAPKQTPPIDSVNWTLGFDGSANTQAINIYINTHDPSGNTRFYRWDFTETWEHQSLLRTFYLIQNKKIVYVSDTNQHAWHCWTNATSTNILLGSSGGLSADIISQAPIQRIYQNDSRMDIRYSMLVRQYALDANAYDYWTLVQKQSQSLGGLFDIQPAQLIGNLHNLTLPAEPVYGYVSASSVQEQRVFISNQDLPGWMSVSTQTCSQAVFTPGPNPGLFDYTYNDPNFTFYRFDYDPNTGATQILITPACIDCTFQGGSTTKPLFW